MRSRHGSPRRLPSSLTGAAGRSVRAECEQLEQRILLAALAPEYVPMVWGGQQVEALKGEWILTFGEHHTREELFAKAWQFLSRLDVAAESIEPIGTRFAKITTSAALTAPALRFARAAHEGVMGIEPNIRYVLHNVPNDPFFGNAWQLHNIGQNVPGLGVGTPGADVKAVNAWDITIGSRNTIVAVIDTGVDLDHPDLAANIWTNPGEIAGNGIDDDGNGFVDDIHGWDFGAGDNNPDDEAGHGTGVAGMVGAVGGNLVGTVGVNWQVSILPMKVADPFGGLSSSAIIASHSYLTQLRNAGVNIVASNNSYGAFSQAIFDTDDDGIPDGFDAEREAIADFIATGATFVAAAGNEGNDNDGTFTSYPASYDVPGIIAVAATDNNDALAPFSSFGATEVHLAAPGQLVYTTQMGGGYAYVSGTSFSAPMVAGAVAMLKAVRPDLSPVDVTNTLIASSDVLASLQGKVQANGRINLQRALELVTIKGPIVTGFDPGPVTGGPISQVRVAFSKPIDEVPFLAAGAGAATLFRAGDGVLGNGNDVAVPVLSLGFDETASLLTITPSSALTNEHYRLTLAASAFKDKTGNFLNGDTTGGQDKVYDFEVVTVSGKFEPNDTLATATPAIILGSSETVFTGALIGDGLNPALDVDIYKVTLPKGGLITARVDAENLPSPSTLDSYLRLFNAVGGELASNDQANGSDSFLQYFVTTGGDYYVGVSGFPNQNYLPSVAASGVSQSTGTYNLIIGVQLVENDLVDVAASDVPLAIPTQGTIESFIFVSDNRAVLDVNVTVDITHDFVSDLKITLISPAGTSTLLASGLGGSGDDYAGTRFDDDAAVAITAGAPPFAGAFRPMEALNRLKGESAFGFWRLRVEDTIVLNSGTLNGWSLEIGLENNVFGPFELNDTITLASSLGIQGSGSTTRDAAIGDGGFGLRDVDIFSFVAQSGSTLNATVTSQGSLNAALRLFDALGNQLAAADPADALNAVISSIIIVNAGTYYIGVSDGSNLAYDPHAAGTGLSATAGDYTLSVSVSSGVGDAQVVLVGSALRAGLGANGSFGADVSGSLSGLSQDGIEFLFDAAGTADAFFGLIANRASFVNSTSTVQLPFATIDESDFGNRRAHAVGVFRGLEVARTVSYASGDRFVVFDIVVTNTTGSIVEDVAWMEVMNPRPGRNTGDNDPNTSNDVMSLDTDNDGIHDTFLPFAIARFTSINVPQGLAMALAASPDDSRVIASVVSGLLNVRDPAQLLSLGVNDPAGTTGNDRLALTFDLGDLASGAVATMRYFAFFGQAVEDLEAMYDALNAGIGGGHLTWDRAAPATDADGIADLPFRLYYPEGFANDRSSTFVPVMNPNAQDARVVVVVRYETGDRDVVVFDGTVAAKSRSAADELTLTTPSMFSEGTARVRPETPYAVEIRSDLPVAAQFSHFDFGVSTGEAFTSTTSTVWTFADVSKGMGSHSFVVFYNPTDDTLKVTTTLLPEGGASPIDLVSVIQPHRRGGWNLTAEPSVPAGNYGVRITTGGGIVVAVTTFDASGAGGFAALAVPSLGSRGGALPEGQIGLSGSSERITLLNAGALDAKVDITFLFANGSAVRHAVTVLAQKRTSVDVGSLRGFPQGLAYAVTYSSNQPVTVLLPTAAFGEINGESFAGSARTLWVFAEGFRPAGTSSQVVEYLRIYNPQIASVVVEIELVYTDGSFDVFRESIGPRRVTEFNIHAFVSPTKQVEDAFYGLRIKGSQPVVAYQGRSDAFFRGSFGTLGTPLGIDAPLA